MDEDDGDYILDATLMMWVDRYGDVDFAVEAAAHEHPAMFAKMYRDGAGVGIGPEDLADYAGAAWWGTGDTYLCREEWRDLFDFAGYREDDCPAERPAEPLLLWRGAGPPQCRNWSWTDVRDVAIHYASGWAIQPETGLVWRANVDPARLLAKISGPRGHAEYIVDTEGLLIEPDGLWCRCPADLSPFAESVEAGQAALDIHELITCPRQ